VKQRRTERLTEIIREEIDGILHTQLADPRLGFVTVTRVKVSADGTHAFIFYSTFGSEEDRRHSREAVESSKSFVRRILASHVKTRTVPELHFIHDTSVEEGEEVLKLIRDLGDG
jgi:ribosome-binding factor A